MNKLFKIIIIFTLVLSSVIFPYPIPFPFDEGENPSKVQAAANDIPIYNGSNAVYVADLIPGYMKPFRRVDSQFVARVEFLGIFRHATIFLGQLNLTGRNLAAQAGLNKTVDIQGRAPLKATAHPHEWFHLVPDDLGTARNLLRTSDLNANTFKSIYGGSPENFSNLTKFKAKNDNDYGLYYYIGDVMGKAGGFAQNTGAEFDSVNATRLQILVTSYPHITEFKSDKTTYNVNEPIKMSFKGFEYAYNKTTFDYTVNVKRDGVDIGSSIIGSGESTKGATSTVAVPAQDSGHTGAIDVPNFEFKPEQPGTYTLELVLKDEVKRDAKKTITVTVVDPKKPTFTITPSVHQTEVGKTVKYTAMYSETGDLMALDVSNLSQWTAVDATVGQSLTRGDYKGLKEGTTQVKATYAGLTATATLIVGAPPPPPPPPPPEIPNLPPVVDLKHPETVYVGEKVCINADASDPDGYISHYQWSYIGGDVQEDDWDVNQYTSSSVCTIYDEVGEQHVDIMVTDDRGAQDEDDGVIEVVYPEPNARFDVTGFYIENRALKFIPRKPYGNSVEKITSEMRITKNIWTITPLDGQGANSAVTIENLQTSDVEKTIQALFRKKGRYEVKRYVENALGANAEHDEIIEIVLDETPVAKLEHGTLFYLDETGATTVTVEDLGYSVDDMIGTRIWEIAHDSDNDGSFTDETFTILDNSNMQTIQYYANKLGKYKVRVTSFEDFNEETYPSLVNLTTNKSNTHRKYTVAEGEFEIDNMAPVVSITAMKQPGIEIVFNTGDVISSGAYSKNKLQDQINAHLLPTLMKENLKPTIQFQDAEYQDDISGDYYSVSAEGSRMMFWVDYETGVASEVKNTVHEATYSNSYPTSSPNHSKTTVRSDAFSYSSIRDYEGNVYFQASSPSASSSNYSHNAYVRIPSSSTGRQVESTVSIYKYDRANQQVVPFIPREEIVRILGNAYHDDESERLDKININKMVIGSNENFYILAYMSIRRYNSSGNYRYTHGIWSLIEFDKNGKFLRQGEIVESDEESLRLRYVTDKHVYYIQDGDNYRSIELSSLFREIPYAEQSSEGDIDNFSKRMLITPKYEIMMGLDGEDREDFYIYKRDRETGVSNTQLLFAIDSGYKRFDRYEESARITGLSQGNYSRKADINLSYDYRFRNSGPRWPDSIILKNDNYVHTEPYITDGVSDVANRALSLYTQLGFSTDGTIYTRRSKSSYEDFIIDKVDEDTLNTVKSIPVKLDKAYVLTYEDDDDDIRHMNVQANYLKRYFAIHDSDDFRYADGPLPIRAWNKSLKQQVEKLEWKSEESTKFYVTLTDKTMPDMPNDKAAVASMFNQDKVNYITIDTNSTKSLTEQLEAAIAEKTMQYTVSSYTDTTVKTSMERIANFIVGVMYPQEDLTIKVHVGYDTSSHTLATVTNRINTIMKPMLAESGIAISVSSAALTNKTVNGQTVKKFNVTTPQDYYILVKDNALTARELTHVSSDLLLGDAYFIGLGKNASKTSMQNVLVKNMNRGKYLDNTDLNASIQEATNYLLSIVRKRATETVVFGLANEDEMLYETHYNDYEDHPKFKEVFQNVHDDTVFEHSQGVQTFTANSLSEKFTKVGLYMPTYQAQDDPLKNYSAANKVKFADYRKWSNIADNVKVYIHRLPAADFTFSLNKNTGALTVQNKAVDLDKESIDIGLGKGISAQKFTYKNNADNIWKTGVPTNVGPNEVYTIRNTVTDYQFQTTYIEKEVSRLNLPPVAEFETSQYEYGSTDSIPVTNYSYDGNGDNLTAKWYIKQKTQPDSAYTEVGTGSFTNNTPGNGWHPTLPPRAEGEYTIKLVVSDPDGLSDSTTRDIKVKDYILAEVDLKGIQIYTDTKTNGLPVKITADIEILNNAGTNLPIDVNIYNQNNQKVFGKTYTVQQVKNGINNIKIPSNHLTVGGVGTYTLKFENYDTATLFITPGFNQITTEGYVATEKQHLKTVTAADGKLSIKEEIMTECAKTAVSDCSPTNKAKMKKHYEELIITATKLPRMKTGYGFEANQTIVYKNDLANTNYPIDSNFYVGRDLIDSYTSYPVASGNAVIPLSMQSNVLATGNKQRTRTFALPSVYVEEKTGNLFTSAQRNAGDSRIKHTLRAGGNKLYIPIWLNNLGTYNVRYENKEPIGVNKLSYRLSDSVEIYAYMYAHMDSNTLPADEILIEPVNMNKPFPSGLPTGWTSADEAWLKQ